MGTSKRFWALCAASAAAISTAAVGCDDNDSTEICVGPDCVNYDGVGGNFFRNNDLPVAGSGGDGGNGAEPGEIPDGGADTPDATITEPQPDADVVDPPDSGTPPPPACELAFTAPLAGDAGNLTFDGSSDTDGEACGSEFTTVVGLTSNAASVTLFINDNPLAPQAVVSGAVSFDAVLGNRGSTGNSLRAVATMADNRSCSITLPNELFVDCPGPSCSVESPIANGAGYLNASQDSDGAAGFQTDIGVVTEIENVSETVRLEVDGTFGDTTTVLEDDGQGIATFGNVSLAEGERTVRAECSDSFGLTTLSPPVSWNVDITPCTLTLDALAGGADPITPGNDVDGAAGLQVLVTGEILGADCKTLWIGPCDGVAAPIPLASPPDGDFSLPITLVGSTGSLSVCGSVEDDAGNVSEEDQIDVNLRLDAPQVAIVSPSESTRFNSTGGGGATVDGNGASSTCETNVVVNCTDVGTTVELFEDGASLGSATCLAIGALPDPFLGQATFTQVSLTSKNDGSNSVLTAQQSVSGLPAGVSPGIAVQADCQAPSCSIVSPSSAVTFLTSDGSADSGFQFSFEVQSDQNGTGLDVGLVIDGDNDGALASALVAGPGGGPTTATFSNVTLDQGVRSLLARCVDAAGNQASDTEDWTVDNVACSATGLTFAGGVATIIPANDSNVAPGLQVAAAGQATGGDCTGARIGICNALSGPFTTLPNDQSLSVLEPTLASTTGAQEVCIEIEDAAGNVGLVQTSLAVRVDLPTAQITSPADLATFNTLSANDCDTDVVVSCSDAGEPVELLVDGVSEDTDNCGNDNTVTFSLSLDSKNDGSLTTLTARHTADGLTSLDAAIQVQADCEAPVLSFSDPSCGDQLALAGDDVGAGAGLQMDVTVLNDGAPEVTLTVTRGITSTDVTTTGSSTSTTFTEVDLGAAGTVDVSACATDEQGNEGCASSCSFTIVAEPTIAITSPAALAVLSTSTTDCDVAAGLQVTVTGTTNAPDGSPIDLHIGPGAAALALASGGTFSACVEAPEGNTQSLVATVTDATTTLDATASILVSVDTIAPGSTLAAPTTLLQDRRRGTVQLSWSSILDSDGDRLAAYRLRCANSDITTESAWTAAAASELAVATTPASSAGVAEVESIVGLMKPGMNRFCVMRGEDDGGQLSPITSGLSLTMSNPFRTQQYAVTDDTGGTNLVNVVVEPLGDINGDSIADFAYGTANQGVDVFFGKTDLDASLVDIKTADFTIRNTTAVGATAGFGSEIAGLGDINGDSRPDFAVSARGQSRVFVFFGRASNTWSNITLTALSPCQADLCVVLDAGITTGLFGWDMASANFDGAGPQDLVISGRSIGGTQTNAGRVFVLLGGTQLATPGTTISLPSGNPDGFIIDPPAGRTSFGVSLAGITGTGGVDDLLIGSNGSLPTATDATINRIPGRTFVGLPAGLNLINVNNEFENGPLGNYGNPVRALGDFDGDGLGDLAVGRNGNQGGIINLYRGLVGGGFNNSVGNRLIFPNELFPGFDDNHGQFTAQGFAPGLGTLGDLDLDGRTELFTGSTTPDAGTGVRGLSNLFYGSASLVTPRTRASADFTYTPTNTQVVPNFVGDINNDTFPDVAVLDSGTGANVIFLMY